MISCVGYLLFAPIKPHVKLCNAADISDTLMRVRSEIFRLRCTLHTAQPLVMRLQNCEGPQMHPQMHPHKILQLSPSTSYILLINEGRDGKTNHSPQLLEYMT